MGTNFEERLAQEERTFYARFPNVFESESE